MEAIKSYIDNVFAAFPQTDEIKKLKRDMLATMEEKYIMLRQGGKSEHEAAYSVIANFGNIEEITAELGLDKKNEELDANIYVSNFEAQAYLSQSKQSGVLVGVGVWLILAGVSSVIVLNNVFLMFLAIAIAVAIFIVNGNKMSAYESFDKTPVRLDAHTRKTFESERAGVMTKCTAMVAAGVVLIILTVGSFTVIELPVPIFLNIVGLSVFLFITSGTYSSAYNVLLGKAECANSKENKQAERIIGTVAAVYWPVITIIFLLWSFVRNAWGISWMIWPIAGILFGAVCSGISIWFGTKGEGREQ